MRREGLVHFSYRRYLSWLLYEGTFLSSAELDFIILRTFVLYSEFPAYLNWRIQCQFLARQSQRTSLFMLSECFLLPFVGSKAVPVPKCHSLWPSIRPVQKFHTHSIFVRMSPLCDQSESATRARWSIFKATCLL